MANCEKTCIMGLPDIPLEDKTLTIIYGSDMVNNNTLNFCSNSDKLTQVGMRYEAPHEVATPRVRGDCWEALFLDSL